MSTRHPLEAIDEPGELRCLLSALDVLSGAYGPADRPAVRDLVNHYSGGSGDARRARRLLRILSRPAGQAAELLGPAGPNSGPDGPVPLSWPEWRVTIAALLAHDGSPADRQTAEALAARLLQLGPPPVA
jgi:hypothetical protein